MELPFVSCLCPTFHRPKLLANALACFLAQDYPAHRRELVIIDDGNDFHFGETLRHMQRQHGTTVRGVTLSERYANLPAKFNTLGRMAQGDILVVWEDDDIYLPHHISSHVDVIFTEKLAFSKPSRILSTYTGNVITEDATGRFHASIAFTRGLFQKTGGWPLTKRADFDQQCMAVMNAAAAVTVDPCQSGPPSYVFRYGSTQAYHGQHFMRSPDDEEWYDRVPRQPGNRDLILYPEFDAETKAVYASHSLPAKVPA